MTGAMRRGADILKERCVSGMPGLLVASMGLLVALTCELSPVQAQDIRIVALQSSAAGGSGHSQEFTTYSSLGTAAPGGTTQNGTLSVAGGGIPLLKMDERLTISFQHEPVPEVEAGENVMVYGTLDQNERITGATLYFRRGGSLSFVSEEMSVSGGGVVSAEIPGDEITREGVVYYFEFRRSGNRIVRHPSFGEYGIAVRVEEPGFTTDRVFPGGADQSAYRVVSVPLHLDDADPESVFGDELGAYDQEVWRFYELRFDQNAREHPNTGPLEPGKGFWIITSNRREGIDTGPGVSVHPARTFSIPLHPSWNLIGNPFAFPIPWSNLSLRSGERLELRSYEGAWNDPISERVTTLEPASGYALFSPSASLDTLDFHPRPEAGTSKSGAQMAGEAHAALGKSGAAGSMELDWWIRIEARSGRSVDRDNIVGIAADAARGADAFDYREPPSPASAVSVYFSRPEWGKRGGMFSTDIRPPTAQGEEWEFDVEGEPGSAVTLGFQGLDRVPPDLRVILIDEMLEVATDLKKSPTYTLSGGAKGRKLKLIVGTSAFVAEVGDQLSMVPTSLELDPVFPNPVRSSMSVRYGLPRTSHVTMRVYDATGRLLEEIDGGSRDAGRHVFVWENGGGSGPLASGVYLLELTAVGSRQVRTFTVVH